MKTIKKSDSKKKNKKNLTEKCVKNKKYIASVSIKKNFNPENGC